MPDYSDFSGITTAGNTAVGVYADVICEGCGFISVDHTGKRVGVDCVEGHDRASTVRLEEFEEKLEAAAQEYFTTAN